jgi:regulatory protein
LIESSLGTDEFDWKTVAASVRQRKFGEAVPAEYPLRAKQMRFLQYRGFSTDQIRAAFVSHASEADELPEPDLD